MTGRAAFLGVLLAASFFSALPGAAHAQVQEAREAQNRGAELQRSGDLKGALREFDRMIALLPQSPFGWFNRGLVKRDLKDCRGALQDLDRALSLDPGMFAARYQHGNCRQALGQYEQAAQDYSKAIAIPGKIEGRFLAYFGRADAMRRMGRLEQAHTDYTSAAGLRADTTALRSRGWVSFYLGRWQAAFDDLSRYVHSTEAKEPDAAYAVVLATLALERAGKKQEAADYLGEWAPRLDAKAWPAPVIQFLQGAVSQASLLKAARGAGQRTEALAYVGERLLAAGERDAGVAALRDVLGKGEAGYFEYDLAYHELHRMGLAQPSERRERKHKP